MVADDRGRAALPRVVGRRTLVTGHARSRREEDIQFAATGRLVTARRGGFALRRPDRPAHLVNLAGPERQRPAQAERGTRVPAIGRDLGHRLHGTRRLRELDVGQVLDAVHAVVAERDPAVRDGDRQEPAARGPRKAADLEDIGAVHAQLELERDARRHGGMIDDPHPLLVAVRPDEPLATDADRPPHEPVERMDLRVRIAVRRGVRHLDAAAVVAAHRGLEQHRPDTPDT